MAKFRVLVIDDELDKPARRGAKTRRAHYQYLISAFDIVFLEKIGDLNQLLDSNTFHIILADFVLDKWATDIRTILAQLNGRYPVGLISSHWGPNFEKLRQTLDEYPKDIAQIFTWEDLDQSDRRELVVIWLGKAVRERLGYVSLVLQESEPIRIVHLSDLQFGGRMPPEFVSETHIMAEKIRKYWGGAPTFIAITGDVVERGFPSEFTAAKNWLDDLAHTLDPKWGRDRYLLIPGNHDLCWSLGLAGKIDVVKRDLSKDKPDDPQLLRYAIEPFRKFAVELGGEGDWTGDNNYWTSGRYRHLGFIFYGYNSCEAVDDWCVPKRELVDPTFGRMFREVRTYRADSDNAIILGLTHHPILGTGAENIVNPQVLYKNISTELSTIVILSGHFHDKGWKKEESESGSILELTASTVAKDEEHRPADSARGLSLIELGRTKGRVSSISVTHCQFDRGGLSIGKKISFKRDVSGRL